MHILLKILLALSLMMTANCCHVTPIELHIQPAIIKIHSENYACSAFYFTQNRLYTAAHCVKDIMADENNNILKLISVDLINDKAVLESPIQGYPLNISIFTPQPYESVMACGYPAYGAMINNPYICERGVILGVDKNTIWTTDLAAPGHSGGPLLNKYGQAIGIVSGYMKISNRTISQFGRI